jgi:hypothetical protein
MRYYQIRAHCTERTVQNLQDITCDEKNVIYDTESEVLNALKERFETDSYFTDDPEMYDESDMIIPTISELRECKDQIECFNDGINMYIVWIQVLYTSPHSI